MNGQHNLFAQSVNASAFRDKLEKLSLVAGDFMKLFLEMQEEYKSMQSPVHRNTYNLLLSTLCTKILTSHPTDKEMFMDEKLLNVMIDLVQRKVAMKLKTPGQIWDSEITDKACKIVANTPLDERKENVHLLKCVSELPPFHPLRAGPGSWHSIHVVAANVRTPEDHMRACEFIRLIQDNFYCEVCKVHFGQYLDQNPPEALLKPPRNNVLLEVKNADTGDAFVVSKLFDWTVRFHNKVNEHRRRYNDSSNVLVMGLPEAYKIYYYRQYDTCDSCKVKKSEYDQ
jgi:hypothetical protein